MNKNTDIRTLLNEHPIISDQVSRQEIKTILGQLDRALQTTVDGAVVEFGCYCGTTSLFIQRYLTLTGAQCAFHVYDSFEGLPEKTNLDQSPAGEQFVAGRAVIFKERFCH